MRIAIPTVGKELSMHFGHCEEFAIIDTDPTNNCIIEVSYVASPEHQPGLLPKWLHEKGVNLVIAGGMGQRAQDLFAQAGVKVIVGAPAEDPQVVVNAYLRQALVTGDNVCDH